MSISPKMSHRQAKILWNSLTPQQKIQFNEMYQKLVAGDLMLSHINVTEQEEIKDIILESKNKPSKPMAPFAKHFDQKLLAT